MKTILVPTDFSPIADNALKYAAAMASLVKGKIILVHAIEFQAFANIWGQMEMKPDERLEPYYYDKLNKLSGQLRLENGFRFTVETLCVHGALAPQVKALVKDKNIDLVIMGTKGADTFGQKFFGTQTATCMREAICPVLAIPAQAHYRELKTVVYAADFECPEERALVQLSRFTQTFKLDITVLNIKSEEQLDIVDDDQVLAEIKALLPAGKFKIVQRQHKQVVPGIWRFINEQQPDVLAITIRERDFLETLFHDSVSEKLLYQHQLPLLALPEKAILTPAVALHPEKINNEA